MQYKPFFTCILLLFYFIAGKILDTESNLFIGKSNKFENFKGFIDEVRELF